LHLVVVGAVLALEENAVACTSCVEHGKCNAFSAANRARFAKKNLAGEPVSAGDFEFSWSLRPKQEESRGVRRFRSGIVAVAGGQTARVHVVNAATEPKPRKTGLMGLWANPSSELLGERTFDLAAGASAFLDSPDRSAGGQDERAQIRAMVTVLDDWEADCVVTLEVFESKSQRAAVLMVLADERRGLEEERDLVPARALLPTGRSEGAAELERRKDAAELDFVLAARRKSDWRRGVRRFRSGIVGVALGQTARVHVVNTASAPDSVAKTAWIQGWSTNPRSEPLTEGTTLRLPSGASVFHDFHPDASAVAPGSRAQVRVSVIVLDDPRAECVVTVEVFNADSGRTAVIVQIPEDA